MAATHRSGATIAVQAGLFDTTPIAGLDYAPSLLGAAEEAELIARIAMVPLAPFRFQGWLGKRETASFGWRYDFADASFSLAEPLPDFLLPLRERLADFAGIAPGELVQALIVRYDPGAGIGSHRDRAVFEHVVAVSLAAPAVLRFRRRTGAGFARSAAARAALGVSPRRRGPPRLAAQHIADERTALVDQLSQPVGAGQGAVRRELMRPQGMCAMAPPWGTSRFLEGSNQPTNAGSFSLC